MKFSGDSNKYLRRICAAVALSAVALSSSSIAREVDDKYVMAVISNSNHGHHVLNGRYEQAIDRIGPRSGQSFDANTNLCVAYTKSGALDSAEISCDAAISEGRRSYKGGSAVALTTTLGASNKRTNLALALSNRGVLYAAQRETELAREAFLEAIELDSGLEAPEQNLARLERKQETEVLSQAR